MRGLELEDFMLPPYWENDTQDPAGNYLAGALKQIHDSSASVFPESEYSTPSAVNNRWKSIVHSDFVPISQQEASAERRELEKKEKEELMDRAAEKNDLVKNRKDHLDKDKKTLLPRMFNKWRVPSRLTSHGGSVQGDVEDDMPASIPTPQLPTISADNKPAPGTAPGTARASLRSYRPPSHASAPPTDPRMVTSAREGKTPQSAQFRSKPPRHMPVPKSLVTKQVLKNYNDPSPHEKSAEELLKNATDHEKKLIEAALRTYRGQEIRKSKAVNNWFNTASNKDKEAARQFFEKGSESSSAQQKMNNVIHRLHKGIDVPSTPSSNYAQYNDPTAKLKHLRLLSPHTRANKQHYQTWHHMPGYGTQRDVINKTSIYTEPQRIPPRHFVIHPDLG